MSGSLKILAFAVLAGSGWAQNTYTISGTVVAENTGKPLKQVMVEIREAHERKPAEAAVLTGDDGRFVFGNLPRGKFSLLAQKKGGFVQGFHQDGSYSTAIVTGPGLHSENILFPIILLGSITGTVLDEENDPVRDAQITLFRRGVFAGKTGVELRQNAQTDSSGKFHFAHVVPGTFLLAASAHPWYAQNRQFAESGPTAPNPELDVAYPITYYGGATDPNSAASFTVSEGASTSIEVNLHAVPAAHVRVASEPNGAGASVAAIGPGGLPIQAGLQYTGTPNGVEICVAPGRYLVSAPNGGKKEVEISGNSSLDQADIPASIISGHMIVEGEKEHPDIGGLLLFSINHPNLQAEVAGNGSFSVSDAEAGKYEVQLPNEPGFYVKSVLVGDRPLSGNELEVTEGSATKISVVVAEGTSNVDGIALKDGAPFAGAMVLIIPQNLSRTDFIRRDQSDSDGTFTLQNVPPGRYTLVAIDNGHDLAYAEPGVINPYLSNAQVIDVPVAKDAHPTAKVQHRQP